MLEFIVGPTGTGKTKRCLYDIKEQLNRASEGAPLFLLLPEHMTFETERELAVLMNDAGGFSRAFVFGFRRLSNYVLNRDGGAIKPHVSEIGKNLLLSRIIIAHRQELTALAKASKQRNFTAFLSAVIKELKTCEIAPDALRESDITDESLQEKLKDIALLYDKFNTAIGNRYNDMQDIMLMTVQKIGEAEWLKDCEIWIDGFTFFNPQELAVLAALFKKAKAVHITLCANDVGKANNSMETALFHRQYMTYCDIRNICKQQEIPLKVTKLAKFYRFLQPAQLGIACNMFSFPLRKVDNTDGIVIAQAVNQRLEVEAVAIDILRLCRDENYKYKDIGIVIREGNYDSILQAVLQDYQIPFFSDYKRLFVHHPLAELLRSCIEAVRTWRYEPLFRCFKTDFFALTRDDIDLLENYILEFGIKGKKHWLSDDNWQYCRNPLVEGDLSLEERDYLDRINSIRNRIRKPLQELSKNLQTASNASMLTQAVYQFLIELGVPEKLSLWQQQAENSAEMILAREQQQIWQNVVDLFDQIVETCGQEELTLKEYAEILNDGLESMQISIIPPGVDYVTIASLEQNNLENKEAIYILGANEGVMPRHVKSEGLLSDSDRLYLSQAGLKLIGGASTDNFFENFLLYKAFTLSRKYLWTSYALSDADGASLNKSPLIDRLNFMFQLNDNQHLFIQLENYSYEDEKRRVVTVRRSVSYLTAALRQYKEKQEIATFWFDVYNWFLMHNKDNEHLLTALSGIFSKAPDALLTRDTAIALYVRNKALAGSVTRFEQFHNCPFKHFARYALRLEEREEYSFSAPDRGILLHETMRAFGQTLLEQHKRWSDISEEDRDALCQSILTNLAAKLQNKILLSSNQYQHLLQRINKTAQQALGRLCDFAGHSEFNTVAMEKPFGRGKDSLAPLTYKLADGEIDISGQIDRIDRDASGQYFLIIDYKSGNAYINIAEVYYGLKLQLLTYILAVRNSPNRLHLQEKPLAAGMLYCFLKSSLLTFATKKSDEQIKMEIIKQMRLSGWILLNPEIIKQIDDSAKFIKVKFNKDGAINKTSRASIKTADEFEALLTYMQKLLVSTADEILSGESVPHPYRMGEKTACMYCPYTSVCHFDLTVPGYDYHDLSGSDDMLMQRIMHEYMVKVDMNKSRKNK